MANLKRTTNRPIELTPELQLPAFAARDDRLTSKPVKLIST